MFVVLTTVDVTFSIR